MKEHIVKNWIMQIGVISILSACYNLEENNREMDRRIGAAPPSAVDQNINDGWIGHEPVAKTITTSLPIDTIVIIDSGENTISEVVHGFTSLYERAMEAAALRGEVNSDYSVTSIDHTHMILANYLGIFQDNDGVSVLDIPVGAENLISILLAVLTGELSVQPPLRDESVKNIVILTDQNLPEQEIAALQAYLNNLEDYSRFYLSTISAKPESQASEWCQFEAVGTRLSAIKQSFPLPGLEFDICDEDWFSIFRNIGQQVAYDWAIAELQLPYEVDFTDEDIYLQVDGRTIPPQTYLYDADRHSIRMKLTDAPRPFSLIEVGHY